MTTRLSPGDTAPDFTLPTDEGSFTLSDHLGRHVIVYFYPAAGTAGCTTQACDFRDSVASLQAAGYVIVGISPDKPAALAKFRTAEHLNFPLASDPEKSVLDAYGAPYNVKATGPAAKPRATPNWKPPPVPCSRQR